MEPVPLINQPALTVDGILVVADIHIGIEYELSLSGIHVPTQVQQRTNRILRYLEDTKADRIILLGDVKHNVPRISPCEREDIPHFLRLIAERATIDIVPGNHDSGLAYLIPWAERFRINLHRSKGFSLGNVGFMHGHTWPALDLLSLDYVIMGHLHPSIRLADPLGHLSSQPVWIRTRFVEQVFRERYPDLVKFANPRVIIMPAFNELAGGIAFNEATYDTLLGPLFTNKALELETAEVYLLDGAYLGTVSQLRHFVPTSRPRKIRRQRRKTSDTTFSPSDESTNF
ncbi:MAG TPA: metallophosphoesterase [Candidatus Acidoferrales bacterium]|nr:metallophosphoesterase [Candidatus Acidoferrales bacterium]